MEIGQVCRTDDRDQLGGPTSLRRLPPGTGGTLSRPFAPKTFLRQVRLRYVMRYFRYRGIYLNLEGQEDKRPNIDEAYDRIWALAPAETSLVEADWAAVTDLSDAAGTDAILREASELAVDLTEIFSAARTGQERALGVLIDHPDVFDRAIAFSGSDGAAGSRWFRRAALPNLPVNVAPEYLRNLEELLRDHYQRDGRGRMCRIEYFRRSNPERHCFFAYPEDHPVGSLVYDEERQLKRVIHRPAFEVAMTYRTAEGAIEVLAPGGKEQCAKIAAVLSAVVLEGDEVEDSFRPAVNLEIFRTRAVSMPTDPRDHVVSVNVAELGYRTESSRNGHLLTFRLVGIRHDPLDIYDLVERACGEANPLLANSRVDRVVLRAVIKPPDAIRPRSVRFALQHPDRCTLGDRRHDQLLRKYLVQWGVLSVRPAKNPVRAAPGRDRQ
jgi:hypothetical protein